MEVFSTNFDSVSWKPLPSASSTSTIVYSKVKIPYKPQPNTLQTLNIYAFGPRNSPDIPKPSQIPHFSPSKTTWLIYIHGGAWRDPLITASAIEPTVQHLASDPSLYSSCIAAVASLNYTLSPYPSHSTHPSSPSDPSRNAKHPQHIRDVITAIAALQGRFAFGNDYVLMGHSCGATLAFQAGAMQSLLWPDPHRKVQGPRPPVISIDRPKAIVGLNGLYDLVALVHKPGPKHAALSDAYADFIEEAFGSEDSGSWADVSPACMGLSWPEARLVILAQSKEDSLVPMDQTDRMMQELQYAIPKGHVGHRLNVSRQEVRGDHDDVWKVGNNVSHMSLRTATELQSATG